MNYKHSVFLLGMLLSCTGAFASPLNSRITESDFHFQTGSYRGLNSAGKECTVIYSSDQTSLSISVYPSLTFDKKSGDRGAHSVFTRTVPVSHWSQVKRDVVSSTFKQDSPQFESHLHLVEISKSKIQIQVRNGASTYADCEFWITP